MFTRVLLIVMIALAQLSSVGSLQASSIATQDCGERVVNCCGEGCTCTPESCPCARPAEPAEQIPWQAPAPTPTASRIDMLHVNVLAAVVCVSSAALEPHNELTQPIASLPRSAFRATLGRWTT